MTARKRASGFCLMDAAFAADAKFVRLARKAKTPFQFAAAVGVFWLILADARRAKSPVVNWDDYSEYGDQIAALKEAKLLEDQGFDATTFDNWAPAYKAPKEVQTGTQEYAEVRQEQSGTLPSAQLASISPSERLEGGVGETDAATFACGFFPNAGEWLMNREYTARWDDLERRFGEWVQPAAQAAYTELHGRNARVKPWDLARLAERRMAERVRAQELAEKTAAQERAAQELTAIQAAQAELPPEERERQDLMRRAVRLWMAGGRRGTVPESVDELRTWLAQHDSGKQAAA